MISLLRRLLAAAAVVVVVSAALAGVAAAHATILTTTPPDGGSVPSDPGVVTATFSEPVSVAVGGLSVRDRDGTAVEQGATTVDDAGTTASVALRPDLPDGTYVATYRVLSADGHPVSGAWIFGIGAEPDPSAGSGGPAGDAGWELVGAVARFVTYLTALLAAGVAFFLAFLHDRRPDRDRLARIVRIAAPLGLVGIVGTVVAQAALLTGEGLTAVTDSDVLRNVLSDRLGWSAAVLLLGLAAVHLSTDVGDLTASQALTVVGGLAVTGSFALWGHDTEAPYRWLAVGSDVVHVAAAAVWFGGLVGVSVVLTRRPPYPMTSTVAVVGRFSTAAAATVAALGAAGLAMTWVELGSVRGLWETAYGRMVLAKVLITAGVIVLAALNRYRILPALAEDTHDEQSLRWRRLRRTVAIEALAIVAVLAVTAVLVNTTPSRTALATATGPVSSTQQVETGSVTLEVAPAEAGRNTMHIQYLDAEGSPLDISPSLTVEVSLPSAALGPIERQVVKLAPGHFVLEGNELSLPGTWTVTLGARTSTFVEQRTTFEVPVTR
ncbi:MAG TPA: CopD family protein [Acidimicrobiales bacterium]